MSLKNALIANKLLGGSGGGGGSSDFSTATVVVSDEDMINLHFPFIIEYEGIEYIATYINDSGSYTVPLYKGNAVFVIEDEGLTVTTTGDIEPIVENIVYLITGDGTISIE